MPLQSASSITSYVGPGGCTHSRPTLPSGEESASFILDCPRCEASLAGNELWGSLDEPVPLTKDEQRARQVAREAARENAMASIAGIPGALKELSGLLADLPARPADNH